MSNLFKNLEIEAFRAGITPRTKQSRDWFRKRLSNISKVGRINRSDLMKSDSVNLKNRTLVVSMQMFFYDPKHKDTLPYYDAFPLVIVIGPAKNGFL